MVFLRAKEAHRSRTDCGALSLVLGGEVEGDLGELLLRHAEHIGGVGKVDIPSLGVGRHIGRLAPLEVLQHGRVIALDPARLVEAERLPATLRLILVEEAVLDHLKL